MPRISRAQTTLEIASITTVEMSSIDPEASISTTLVFSLSAATTGSVCEVKVVKRFLMVSMLSSVRPLVLPEG